MSDNHAAHIETDKCGFDRNGSHSAGHYVCDCGWNDVPFHSGGKDHTYFEEQLGAAPEQPAPQPNNDAFFESAKLPYPQPAAQDGLVDDLRAWVAGFPYNAPLRGCMEQAADTIAAQQAEIAELKKNRKDMWDGAVTVSALVLSLTKRAEAAEAEIAELRASQKFLHGERMEEMRRANKAEAEIAELRRQLRFKTNLAISNLADAERAESERDALKVDAERYRWIRNNLGSEAPMPSLALLDDLCSKERRNPTAMEFDAAIDAARRGE